MQGARGLPARLILFVLLCAGPSSCSAGAQSPQDGRDPLTPDEALASFELEPGYRIELVAAEPLIRAPVAIAFDERGRLYVVENRGYPGPLEGAPDAPPQGVIARLEDRDGNGRFDARTEFATGLTYPNGVMPWKGGVFVTCAPDLLYIKDTDGDGVADERRVALTGFATTRTPQIRFSHPTLAIDNWVYLTSGLNGGRITAPDRPDQPAVEFTTSDSRFNPRTLAFELTGGRSQYGLTFDDYGRRFTCSNRHPVWHVVLEPRYLKRNPHLAFSETVHEVSAVGGEATVWPISTDMTTASFHPSLLSTPHAGTFTAASGVHLHRGDALPEDGRDSIFICESAQNLVQRQVRSPAGVTFTSRPARIGREFLASRDQWFRPVFAANGPDGALYIVDMYRKNIDHPQYLPEESRGLLDFEAGKERGRIYRITARDWKRTASDVNLDGMGASELSQTFEHPNAWWRETAQRLLIERGNTDAVPHLRRLVTSGQREAARLHALWTLDGLGALENSDIRSGLRDSRPVVRENAVRLAETRLGGSSDLLQDVLRLANDDDNRVRFHVALALGEAKDVGAIGALAAIARRDGADSWMRAAILSSLADRSPEFFRAFMRSTSSITVRAAVLRDLGQVLGASQSPERCREFIGEIAELREEFGWQPAALSGVAEGLRGRESGGGHTRSAFARLLSADSAEARAAKRKVDAVVNRSGALVLDNAAAMELRLSAIAFMAHTDYSLAGPFLERLLATHLPSQIQIAAVRALAQLHDDRAISTLVNAARWATFTPAVREAVFSSLLGDAQHTLTLLSALEQGSIPITAVGPSRRARLLNHRDDDIRERARRAFAAVTSGDRMQVYERLRAALANKAGDPARGQHVFAAHCASCHAVGGAGGQLGPDLSGIRNQPADAILLHVLVPDFEITPAYEGYVVETRDGKTLVGRLESEAPNSLTLRDASSQPHVVLRDQVASMTASTTSLMPSELERAMSEQDLADLIRFLKR